MHFELKSYTNLQFMVKIACGSTMDQIAAIRSAKENK
jgi:hypothetical protein